MHNTIAFVSRYDQQQNQNWLKALNNALKTQNIIAVDEMSKAQKQACSIAIVANPDLANIALLPNLQLIHSLWAGVETLVDGLPQNSAPIIRLKDPELTRTMAEAVLAWSYYIQRDMPFYRLNQMAKKWQPRIYRSPSSMTIGIVGFGTLGQASAKILNQAGFHVVGWSRTPKKIDGFKTLTGDDGLTELLHDSDIVVLLLPLTKQTKGLMNDSRFLQMKQGAVLINFARGPIVDAQAMLKAIERKQLSHVVLDVFNVEPLPPTCPYWHNEAITLLPHIAAETSMTSAAQIVADNIATWQKTGCLPALVDRHLGY